LVSPCRYKYQQLTPQHGLKMDETSLQPTFQGSLADRLNLKISHDIFAIQKTHTTSDLNLLNRGKLPGFKLIVAIHSNVHGIATYVRDTLADYSECSNNIHVIDVEMSRVTVVNLYKTPSSNWSSNTLKVFPTRRFTLAISIPTIIYGAMNITTRMEIDFQNG
jgi:exonuclease III